MSSNGQVITSDVVLPDRRARRLVALLLAGWGCLGLEVAVLTILRSFVLQKHQVELPWATRAVFSLGVSLWLGFGWVALGLGAALLVLPARVVPGSRHLRTYLGLGIAQVVLLGVCVWLAVELPTIELERFLTDGGPSAQAALDAHRRLLLDISVVFPATLCVTLVQAVAWLLLSIDALRLPPARARAEALRAVMISALPIVVVSPLVGLVVFELRLASPEGLLMPPALAAAGTTALAIFGAALALRLRRGGDPT